MGRWRSWILFGLIAYFGGFSTAIYYLAPVSKDSTQAVSKQTGWMSRTTADKTDGDGQASAGQFNERMRTCVAFAEEQCAKAVSTAKVWIAEAQKETKQ